MAERYSKYADTAARKHGKPGREIRPKSTTIDIHAHILLPKAAQFAGPHLTPEADMLGKFSSAETREVQKLQGSNRYEVSTQLDQRLKDMDGMGVDMQLIMSPPGQCYYTLPLDLQVKAAHLVNEGIAEYVARKPDRFVALGSVPMVDGNEAAKELERMMRTYGFKGVQILTNINGKEISDPAHEPFWKKAEELGAVVLLHPNGFTQAQRFGNYYFTNVIGNPMDTTVALHYLIFDGILERYPNLKIITVHGGGFLGGYSGRIDHAWGARSDAHGGLPKPPTSYLKKIWFDTVVFTPHQLEALVKTFGVDKILMGTDYPFDMAEYDPIGHVASVEMLDAQAQAAINGGNAKKLLGL
jgi:aminocarboxymuconate-semialdehyde decarboxylase